MLKPAILLTAGAAVLAATPADARYRHHHRHYRAYSYYSPYQYAYPAYNYSYPVYSYRTYRPAYYGYPSYYGYPAYSYPGTSISIGYSSGYRPYRRW